MLDLNDLTVFNLDTHARAQTAAAIGNGPPLYAHMPYPFFEITPPGAAPGPPVKPVSLSCESACRAHAGAVCVQKLVLCQFLVFVLVELAWDNAGKRAGSSNHEKTT